MNATSVVTIVILFLILAGVFAYYLDVRKANLVELIESSPAESVFLSGVSYTDIDGNTLQVTDFTESTVIAVAWASWCPQCVEQLRILDTLAEEFDEVAILAFNRAEPQKTAKDFLAFHNLETNIQLVLDTTDNFYASIGGHTMPETVIFNARGEIVHHERDLFTKEEIVKVLEELNKSN